jgi:ABC-type transport system involved in cytochrome c biogenesis permease subunit
VAESGRVKPVDAVARNLLRLLSERDSWKDGEKTQSAVRWFLDVVTDEQGGPERARKDRVFRIDHPQIRDALGLEEREGFRYSIEEFGDRLSKIQDKVKSAHDRQSNEQELDAYEKQLLKFWNRLQMYSRLASLEDPHFIPPSGTHPEWQTIRDALGQGNADAHALVEIFGAYAKGDVAKFNQGVEAYLKKLDAERPGDVERGRFESFFNRFDPFTQCATMYFIAFVLICISWLAWEKPLWNASMALLWVTFAIHTLALLGRIYLSGRPPVTNLYSSAIFIGWGGVFIALVLEHVFPMSIAMAVAALEGFCTLLIAYFLSFDGDTLEVLQAVLDTPFWLATHVTCITLGYATTFLAGTIGILYIARGLLTRSMTEEMRSTLARMMYGVICFAMFFSFVGTVLGGLWADDSWGRFWGWDPKENGALMIVLWNALILHARWGGLVRERGLAVLTVCGNIVVSWSWFGVNVLNKGLHSYGFTDSGKTALQIYVFSQLAIIAAGMLPRTAWKSPDAVRPEAGDPGKA